MASFMPAFATLAALFKRTRLPRWAHRFPSWFFPVLQMFSPSASTVLDASAYPGPLWSRAPKEHAAVGRSGQIWEVGSPPARPFLGTRGLAQLVAKWAQQLLGGDKEVLISNNTCPAKYGSKSVGVGRQYSGQVGKITNCQYLVSVTVMLAQDEIPISLRLKLFLAPE